MSPDLYPQFRLEDAGYVSHTEGRFAFTLPAREPREPWLPRLARILRDVWHKGRW